MYKVLAFILFALVLVSCQKREFFTPDDPTTRGIWFEPTPYGMAYVQRGSYEIGPTDDEILLNTSPTRTISVEAFWMDDTEISNNEYRQFIYYVRDSIARTLLGVTFPEFVNSTDKEGVPLKEPTLNWKDRIEWDNPEYQLAMKDLYVPDDERFNSRNEIDSRKLIYEYYWVDYTQAARRANSFNFEKQKYDGSVRNEKGEIIPIENRRSFLKHERVPVYPDTLCWIRDFAYSYNEPMTYKYFSHRAFDDYPVVGVSWPMAQAFCNWRTNYINSYSSRLNETPAHDYRLPTESEWELAARGGLRNCMYPWGSYYARNTGGCFLANFKPLRGNYVADSPTSVTTMQVGSFDPNPYGLYDMGGNVAEWTSSAFFESSYDILNDLNPEVQYDASPDDPITLKRKVVRGGSWKDMAYFIRTSTRSFEYQDTTKSYIGFRCVRTSFRNDLQGR